MATFGDLPAEVRNIIYKYLFAGEKLTYKPLQPIKLRAAVATNTTRATDLTAASILLVSRRCYSEGRPVLLHHATINLTGAIWTGDLLAMRGCPWTLTSSILHVEVDLKTILISRSKGAGQRLECSLYHLSNLQTLTLLLTKEDGQPLQLGSHSMMDGPNGILDRTAEIVKGNPYQMMGRGQTHQLVLGAWRHWKHHNRAYDLRTRLEVRMLPSVHKSMPFVTDMQQALARMHIDDQDMLMTYLFRSCELEVEATGWFCGGPVRTAMRIDFADFCWWKGPCNPYCHSRGPSSPMVI